MLPVAKWDIGLASREFLVFRPHVMTGPDEDPDDAEPSNYYALTPIQARELAEQIADALAHLEDEEDEDEDGSDASQDSGSR